MFHLAATTKMRILSVILSIALICQYGISHNTILFGTFCIALLRIAREDLKSLTVDDFDIICAVFAILLILAPLGADAVLEHLASGLTSLIIMGFFYLICVWRGYRENRAPGLGSGDVTVSFLIGFVTGWQNFVIILYGAGIGIWLFNYYKNTLKEYTPFVPALAIAAIVNCMIPGGLSPFVSFLFP